MSMTRAQLVALRAAISASPELQALAPDTEALAAPELHRKGRAVTAINTRTAS